MTIPKLPGATISPNRYKNNYYSILGTGSLSKARPEWTPLGFPSQLIPDGVCHDTDSVAAGAALGVVAHAQVVAHLVGHGGCNSHFIPVMVLWKKEQALIYILEAVGTPRS